jgi:hypothetical protein
MPNFKLDEQYHIGKLQEGGSKTFVRTPKPQIYTGRDLKKRGIRTFEEFYEKNPCNFKEGDNISICVKNEHDTLEDKMTKTILAPVGETYRQGLSDDVTPLHQQNQSSENKDLVKSYQGQIDYLQKQSLELQKQNNEYNTKILNLSREKSELELDLQQALDKLTQKTEEYDKLWKEFGDLIKEARNPAPPSLGDRIGSALADPEIMGMAKDGLVYGIEWLKSRRNGGQLQDSPPAHAEPKITEDESQVFE